MNTKADLGSLLCFAVHGFVLTRNDTKNLDFLRSKDFLANRRNVVVLSFSGRPGEAPPSTAVQVQV